jgi:hypothetical protein
VVGGGHHVALLSLGEVGEVDDRHLQRPPRAEKAQDVWIGADGDVAVEAPCEAAHLWRSELSSEGSEL